MSDLQKEFIKRRIEWSEWMMGGLRYLNYLDKSLKNETRQKKQHPHSLRYIQQSSVLSRSLKELFFLNEQE
jgi:hypothetical protein